MLNINIQYQYVSLMLVTVCMDTKNFVLWFLSIPLHIFFKTQHNKNGGKCGVCGEEYLNPNKRLEPGPANKYATGTIVGNYVQGETSK